MRAGVVTTAGAGGTGAAGTFSALAGVGTTAGAGGAVCAVLLPLPFAFVIATASACACSRSCWICVSMSGKVGAACSSSSSSVITCAGAGAAAGDLETATIGRGVTVGTALAGTGAGLLGTGGECFGATAFTPPCTSILERPGRTCGCGVSLFMEGLGTGISRSRAIIDGALVGATSFLTGGGTGAAGFFGGEGVGENAPIPDFGGGVAKPGGVSAIPLTANGLWERLGLGITPFAFLDGRSSGFSTFTTPVGSSAGDMVTTTDGRLSAE